MLGGPPSSWASEAAVNPVTRPPTVGSGIWLRSNPVLVTGGSSARADQVPVKNGANVPVWPLDPIDRSFRPLGVPAVDGGQRVDAGDLLTNVGVLQPAGFPRQFDKEMGLLGLGSLGVLGGAGYVCHEPSLVTKRGL